MSFDDTVYKVKALGSLLRLVAKSAFNGNYAFSERGSSLELHSQKDCVISGIGLPHLGRCT